MLRALESQALGLVDGLLQLGFLQDVGEIEQCPGGGRYGDALFDRDLVLAENGSVEEESAARPQ